jgi:alpha-glucosidase
VSEEAAWWQEAVFYQIYPRSFCLADPAGRRARLAVEPGSGADRLRDGAGDLEGIRRRLEHLSWLGVDAIWLSPFQPSPMADFGYDISDYCDVEPLFGTLGDFDRLLGDVHERGMRMIVDWVPNHTSDLHPWFLDSRSSPAAARRGWYVWRDGKGEGGRLPPNNWRRAFGEGPSWTFDESSGQWYLHLFLPEQPDLDWSNPEVRQAMEEVMSFWLRRGIDGFRIDVVHALGKDTTFPDAPEAQVTLPWAAQNDHQSTHTILSRLRSLLDSWPQEPVAVGEVFLLDTTKVAEYCGPGQLHLGFDFTPMYSPFTSKAFGERIEEAERLVGSRGGWPTWVLSSHDRSRHRTRYGSEAAARAAAVLLLTLRGTPFLYAGEELGLEDAVISEETRVDPGGRDGCRAAIPWDGSADHGWELEGSEPWLPWSPHPEQANAERQRSDPASILHLYRQLLALRRSAPALRSGTIELLESGPDVLAYERRLGDDALQVAVNFAFEPRPAPAGAKGRVTLLSSAGEAGAVMPSVLDPYEAIVSGPA